MTDRNKNLQAAFILVLVLGATFSAQAQDDPCAGNSRRALVLSGGGTKGAFQTGAIYHLVVHRGCDFHEFSGVSVGALNAAFLAQAAEADDSLHSHAHLAEQAEGLVSLWGSIRGQKDVARGRFLAGLRFGLFGIESLNDFKPLRRLLEEQVSLDKLAHGRPVQVGVVNFWDGAYRDVSFRSTSGRTGSATFHDYVFASSVLPVLGKMPRLREPGSAEDPGPEIQFGDGSLRHITPIAGYFQACTTLSLVASLDSPPVALSQRECAPGAAGQDRKSLQQLFVIATSPYSRESDLLPVTDSDCCPKGKRQITKGPKVMNRTLALMVDATYRQDLDTMLLANDLLRWRWQMYRDVVRSGAEAAAEGKQSLFRNPAFPFESFNRDFLDPDAPSLPYEVALILPEAEYAGAGKLLKISPAGIRKQLYCGCLAADKLMTDDLDLPSMAESCAQRFPPLSKKKSKSAEVPAEAWDEQVCQQPGQ